MKSSGTKKYGVILRCCAVFAVTALICAGLLFAADMIPQSAVRTECTRSAGYYMKKDLFPYLCSGMFNTRQDNYADCILNNIIYSMDSSKPVISTLRAAYYQKPKEDVNKSFMAAVQQGLAPNTDYSRYWHGSMVVLRPLFTFMDIVQIRLLLGVLAAAGIAAAVWMLWREGQKVLAVSFAAGAVWVNTWMLTKCIEYVTTFLVMDAMLMILIAYLRKHTSAEARTAFLYRLLVGGGVVTCFVDFLTTETLTYTMPMLVFIAFSVPGNKIKDGLMTMIRGGIAWLAGYTGMFALKWGLAYAALGMAALKDSVSEAAIRIGGTVYLGDSNLDPVASPMQRLGGALWHNIGMLFPFSGTLQPHWAVLAAAAVAALAFCIVYLTHGRNFCPAKWVPVSVLALLPYLRYLALSNHAYMHYFFTYRAQLVTVTALIWYVSDTVLNRDRKKRGR